MSDRFTNDEFTWLRQVAADASLAPAASRVAIALTAYFNRKHDGWAWMAQATLADDLGVSEITVRRALAAMVKRGHLRSKRRGCEETNLYHLALKNEASDRSDLIDHDRSDLNGQSGVTDQICPSDRSNQVKVTDQKRSPNPLNEPLEEPIEKRESLSLDFDDKDSGRRRQSPSVDHNADFEEFWRQYPKRVAEEAALKAYRAVIKTKKVTSAELLAGAMRYAAERSGQDPRFTKHPASWLNAGCWADEPTKPIGVTLDGDGNPVMQQPSPPPSSRSWMKIAMAGFDRGQP